MKSGIEAKDKKGSAPFSLKPAYLFSFVFTFVIFSFPRRKVARADHPIHQAGDKRAVAHPAQGQRAIQSKIGLLAENPQHPELDIKKMKGEKGYFRLRVGTYRILFTEDGVILDIRDIGPRGSIYRT